MLDTDLITGTWIRGACPHDCPDTCAILSRVEQARVVSVKGDPAHAVTQGWLCAKVQQYTEHVYHPDRLLYPMRRCGPKGSGKFERISWADAQTTIASTWTALIQTYGGACILPYSYSGTLGLLQMSVSSSRLWNRMGASGLQRSICGAAAEAAVEATLGARWSPDLSDLQHSRVIILWGHNPAATAPHVIPYLRQAQQHGAKIILIDPQRTLTAKTADHHIAPLPATDGALALGIAHVLVAEKLINQPWINQYTQGFAAFQKRLSDYSPTRVSQMTGLPADRIVWLARLYASAQPASIKIADGLQRHGNGGQTIRAITCLPALLGYYGQRGGGLYYSTSGYVKWDPQTVGYSHHSPQTPRTINMNRLGAALTGEAQDPPIQSLYIFGANPVASSPNSNLIRRGLLRNDLFTVVHELFLTDTARYADIVLPATSQLEQVDLHKPYGHPHLQYNHPAIAPLGEARSNWDTCRTLASAMGYTDPWLLADGQAVIDEILTATAKHNPRLKNVTLQRLQQSATIAYDLPGDHIPFADGVYPTQSGKVELECPQMATLGLDPLPSYCVPDEFCQTNDATNSDKHPPLTLITAAAHHFVTSSMANHETLRAKQGPPRLDIHPHDATARGISDGAIVKIENSRGDIQLTARVTDRVRPGVVASPKGHWALHHPQNNNINCLTPDAVADLAGQSTFHSNWVWVTPVHG